MTINSNCTINLSIKFSNFIILTFRTPSIIRLEQFTNNFKLSNNNNYESYTLSYEYYNASTSYDWEFEYNDFFAYICSFTEYIEANSISIESETITI